MTQEGVLAEVEVKQSPIDELAVINDLAERLVGNTKGDPTFIDSIQKAWAGGKYDEPIPYGGFMEDNKRKVKTKSIRELLQEGLVAFDSLVMNKIGGEAKAMIHQQRANDCRALLSRVSDSLN